MKLFKKIDYEVDCLSYEDTKLYLKVCFKLMSILVLVFILNLILGVILHG